MPVSIHIQLVVEIDVQVQIGSESDPGDVWPEKNGGQFFDGPCLESVPDDQPFEQDDTDQAAGDVLSDEKDHAPQEVDE